MSILAKFNLPTYIKGKPFSDASAMIAKRFEGRNSPEDKRTLDALQGRLKEAQEYVKAEQQKKQAVAQGGAPDVAPDGGQGMMPPQGAEGTPQEAMPQEGMQEQAAPQSGAQALSNKFFGGGALGDPIPKPTAAEIGEAGDGVDTVAKGAKGAASALGGASGGPGAGGYAAMAGTAMELGQQAFGSTGIDTSGASEAPEVPSAGMAAAGGAMKGAAAGAMLGPVGMAAGAVIGGAAGWLGGSKAKKDAIEADANHTYGKHATATNKYYSGGNLGNPDPPTKGGVSQPSLEELESMWMGSKDGGQPAAKTPASAVSNAIADPATDAATETKTSADPTNPNKGKGKMYDGITLAHLKNLMGKARNVSGMKDFDPMNEDHVRALQKGMREASFDNPNYFTGKEKSYIDKGGANSINNSGIDGRFGIDTFTALQQMGMSELKAVPGMKAHQDLPGTIGSTKLHGASNKGGDEGIGDDDTGDGFNAGELLRYAPAAMNAYQLATLKKPGQIGLDRLGDRYKPQRVDERGLQNAAQNAANVNKDAIQSASGLSASAARASLLGSEVNATGNMSKAYQAATGENRQDARKEQDFNANINKANLNQSNQETNLNLEQKAAYQTNKSKLLSQLGNDLGGVGREELFKKYPERMGMSYEWDGDHIKSMKDAKSRRKAQRQLKRLNRKEARKKKE